MEHDHGTVAFFQAMAPVLIANVLTVAFVYCFAKVHQKELRGEESRRFSISALVISGVEYDRYNLFRSARRL
jgi:hypothetical protein